MGRVGWSRGGRSSSPDPRITALLAEAEQRWGRGALVRWGDAAEAAAEVDAIPTGFPGLDDALGIGGLPCGRISELFGADSSGKHALAASIAAQCQRQEGVAVWIDPAERLDPKQMKAVGVDSGSMLVARPRNNLEALELAIRLARGGGMRLIILETEASISGSGDTETSPPPTQWRAHTRCPYIPSQATQPSVLSPQSSAMGLALRRLIAALHRNGIAFLFITSSSTTHHPSPITHYSTQSSVLSPHRSSGGQALRYFASVRLEMERREWIRRGREVMGCRSSVRVVKNKLAAPHREAEVDLLFYSFPAAILALSPCQRFCRQASCTH